MIIESLLLSVLWAPSITGGADDYLRLLVGEIMLEAEKELPGSLAWRGVTGYSLAGLLALYAVCQTGVFSWVGCMLSSLWFPGFGEHVFSYEPKRWANCIYFFLGDREAKTRNPVLKTVQGNTEAVHAHFLAQGTDMVSQLNPGNYFVQGIECTAAGIRWLLGR